MFNKEEKKVALELWELGSASIGSSQVQICLLTARIKYIAEHLKGNHKDHSSRLGLVKMVGKRKRLLTYLKRRNESLYYDSIKRIKA
ncbi:30S ribosomal protein S15 [Candidatus Babeliales bacterium]|nr:30S ribosomal protein S15 [Candidatus Babeliales bacterium]